MQLTRYAMLVLPALALPIAPAAAQQHIEYPWCANYASDFGGATNCGFSTIEQCRATIAGMGGFCEPNSFYNQSAQKPASRKRKKS